MFRFVLKRGPFCLVRFVHGPFCPSTNLTMYQISLFYQKVHNSAKSCYISVLLLINLSLVHLSIIILYRRLNCHSDENRCGFWLTLILLDYFACCIGLRSNASHGMGWVFGGHMCALVLYHVCHRHVYLLSAATVSWGLCQ